MEEKKSNFGFQVGGVQFGVLNEQQKENKEKWTDFRERLETGVQSGDPKTVANTAMSILNVANPAAAIPRAGVLAGMRLNIFGLARKLYVGTLSPQEIKDKRVNPDEAKKARDLINGKIDFYWTGLGGNTQNLIETIRAGYDKPVFDTAKLQDAKRMSGFNGKTDEYSNVTGYDDAAVIAAGIGLLTAILGMVNQAQLAKNPYLGADPLGTPPPEVSDEKARVQAEKIINSQKRKKTNQYVVWGIVGFSVLSICGMLIWKYTHK